MTDNDHPRIPGHSYAGGLPGDLNRDIGDAQRGLLRDFFGSGVDDALAANHSFRIPDGLTRETVERYHEIARYQILRGADQGCVQHVRLCLMERALEQLGGDKSNG